MEISKVTCYNRDEGKVKTLNGKHSILCLSRELLTQKKTVRGRMKIMSLLQEWRDYAYANDTQERSGQLFWANYFNIEKEIYKKLLADADKVWEGSVASLAKELETKENYFVGFLDGINDSLVTPNPVEEMDLDTKVCLTFDKEKLYYNMVAAGADWLYDLEEWESLLST